MSMIKSYAAKEAGGELEVYGNEFLSLTRTAYLGQAGKQQSMETAMRTALDTAKADAKTSKIAVVQSPSADTDNTKPAASAFAGTIKTGLYPLLLVMPICTFLVIGTFNDSEIRRRLYSSPTRLVSLQMHNGYSDPVFKEYVAMASGQSERTRATGGKS